MHILAETAAPPWPRTATGMPRRIGVEIEFAAVGAEEGAHIVRDRFGGRIVREDDHRFHIEDTRFGRFTCELDTQYAHRPKHADEPETGLQADVLAEMRRVFGDISALVMPCEIVCPPLPLKALAALDDLVGTLVAAGATGTRASPFFAFGVQLNVEIARTSAAWITQILRAYLLLSPWLRDTMSLDLTRRAVSFADPFPQDYAAQVLAPGYRPDLGGLVADYLYANPTRNRELDLLPLFAELAPTRVRAAIDDPRVNARPAFHYRLPDANLGEPRWSLRLEWNRWCVVERLAARPALVEAMAADYLARRTEGGGDWPRKAAEWLILAGG